jgi:hypothetical protein
VRHDAIVPPQSLRFDSGLLDDGAPHFFISALISLASSVGLDVTVDAPMSASRCLTGG